jgi:hypothetical protein
VEPLPDLGKLSDADLRTLIKDLVEQENEVSFQRRMLHGKIDILRAELVSRLQTARQEGHSALEDVDVEKLSAILASKAAPRVDERE